MLLQVYYEIFLCRGAEEDRVTAAWGRFTPTSGSGHGRHALTNRSAPGRPPFCWDDFWSDSASPYCRDGVVRGRFTLSVSADGSGASDGEERAANEQGW